MDKRLAHREAEPGKRSGYELKAFKVLVGLDGQWADVLRFTTDFAVPFEYDQTERDILLVNVQEKISGSWSILEGESEFCAIRSCA